jgi:hypothetical protein
MRRSPSRGIFPKTKMPCSSVGPWADGGQAERQGVVARRLPRPAPRQMPGDAECQRVSHFCGAVARARAAQAAAREPTPPAAMVRWGMR